MADNPQSPKNLEETLTNFVHKILVVGGFGGGGTLALIDLSKDDADVPKALLKLAIGSAISLATKFFLPIQQGNEGRAETLGQIVNQAMDDAGEKFYARALSMEKKYLKAQTANCELLKIEGTGKIPGLRNNLMLEQVFVPLELDQTTLAKAGFREFQKEFSRNSQELALGNHDFSVEIWDLLKRTEQKKFFRQIAILAWGGYGKTTLLSHVAYTLGKSEKPKFIPVLLLLRQYREILSGDTPPSLPELIAEHHIPRIQADQEITLSANWALEQLRKGRMLVMLDGFEEVPSQKRTKMPAWLNEQMRKYPKSVFILTSRPKAYAQQSELDLYSTLYVKPFDENQRKTFVGNWYRCQEYLDFGQESEAIRIKANKSAAELLEQIEARKELRDLASNPLLLTMIARFHRRFPGVELPKRRPELYQEICTLRLQDRPNTKKLETLLRNCEAQVILQMLALEMMQRKEERLEERVLLRRLKGYLTAQDENLEAKVFLEQIEQISELLVQREPQEYEFAHLSFQEFLAAMEVIRLEQEALLYEQFTVDWWKQTILLYVGRVRKPSRIIRAAREAGATDLAFQCTQETTRRIDDELLQDLELAAEQKNVTAERYRKLEELLIAAQTDIQKWQEADEETYRLMITAVGKEKGQGFSGQNLKEFPCDELRAIDRLWVKHSNGLYGFSVQKDIYVECGGTLDYEYPSEEVYKKFYEAIAWREKGEWKLNWYEILDQRRMETHGHLPYFAFTWHMGSWSKDVLLFSRVAL